MTNFGLDRLRELLDTSAIADEDTLDEIDAEPPECPACGEDARWYTHPMLDETACAECLFVPWPGYRDEIADSDVVVFDRHPDSDTP